MKVKSILLLAVAVGCGLVAMLGVQQVLSSRRTTEVKNTKAVLVATTDIAPGTKLSEANTKFEQYPVELVPEAAVSDMSQIPDHSLRIAAVANDVILTTKLNPKGQHGASQEIPQGMRVFTVPVNATQTHSGLIMPGDRVDVVVTYKSTAGTRRSTTKTKTLMERIKVFAADAVRQSAAKNNDSGEYDAKNISLLVTPDQYNMCVQASKMGTISLPLRNKGDESVAEAAEYDDEMLGNAATTFAKDMDEDGLPNGLDVNPESTEPAKEPGQAQAAVKVEPVVAPGPPQWTIKIYAGHDVREQQVDLPVAPSSQGISAPSTGPEADKKKADNSNWLKSFITGA